MRDEFGGFGNDGCFPTVHFGFPPIRILRERRARESYSLSAEPKMPNGAINGVRSNTLECRSNDIGNLKSGLNKRTHCAFDLSLFFWLTEVTRNIDEQSR